MTFRLVSPDKVQDNNSRKAQYRYAHAFQQLNKANFVLNVGLAHPLEPKFLFISLLFSFSS